MLPKEFTQVIIQSYKHDESLHRTWSKGMVMEATDSRIVVITNKTWVIESDGRRWLTREPAVCFFYPNKWFNVIAMIRKNGIYYYCNLASPTLYDGEALKNIDYDLDVKIFPDGSYDVLDENEFSQHKKEMSYPLEIETIVRSAIQEIIQLSKKGISPFNTKEVNGIFQEYLQKNKR